ncbi:hypothetical protein METSCH_F03320 [Metschnikowia aff. pulcherrima]|uniref:Uncharacterized protein n=1 Tax=Metschnikowia aff. pulcherrima TaxID=2163413 RepID=A0A4P6XV24_9ASCO|nr:hypothetical protein METSCH_F03320 [Metschnikowia aff. pulcherrima]
MRCVLASTLFLIFVARPIASYASANETLGAPMNSIKRLTPGALSMRGTLTGVVHDMKSKVVESDDAQLFLKNESIAVSQVLDWFVNRLRMFINNAEFKNEAFEEGVDLMRKDLNAITKRALLIPDSAAIKNQLCFATYFFLNMEDSANVLRMYRTYITEIHMASWIVYIHLSLLRLFNLHGIPDLTTPGYLEILKRLRRLLVFWGSVFSELQDVLPLIAAVFEDKLSLAEKVLIYLEQHNSPM